MPSGSGNTGIDNASGVRAGDLVAGHYRVERVLGSGGMGVVVAARDERNGDAVAVKLLRSVDDTRSVERFFREARAMGRLDSRHVVRVRDAGSDGNKPYLVMDQLAGIDLSERSKRAGRLPVMEAADYLLQACEALSHAHSKGIVHRDVKPSNLFLHTEGAETILKVLDFGISKVQSRDVWERTLTTTDDGGVLGSPPYMSPEQVRDPKAVDPRSDVWSLGVVLYKILSGGVPFDGDSVGEVFAKVLERPYSSLRELADVPEDMDDAVRRCLAKNRDDRFAHVGELALALAPFASPRHAALAPRIAQRMQDEGPTLARASSVPEIVNTGRGRAEPSTMSLSGPPPEARQSAPPPALHPFVPPPPGVYPDITPQRMGSTGPGMSAAGSVPPPALPSGAAPALTALSANTSSVSMDVVGPAPSRAKIALLLGVLGVAAGIGIGLAVRGGGATGTRPEMAAPTAPPTSTVGEPAVSAAGIGSGTGAGGAASAGSTASTGASASAGPGAVPGIVRGRPRGTRKPVTGAGTGTGAGAATGASTATTVRPELQPSPYPTNQ